MPEAEFLENFIQFGIVGFIGLLIDFSVTYFLKERIRVDKYLANACGFSLVVINNFILNKYWTFENTSDQFFTQFGMFVLVSVIGLGLNHTSLYVLHGRLNREFYLSKLVAIGIVMFWNFGMNQFFVFSVWTSIVGI